ncbi:MAG TPA: hypothetical protein VLL98_03735 [Rickettsiales bacterium]|nr:hypothetical protein [Rickettsiales bacterium]
MNVLLIGLNDLSKKMIKHLKSTSVNTFGFDFNIDKVELFHQNGLIKNNSKTILEDLLKQMDILILNIDISRYKYVFKLSPFIKPECLIINTNSYKEDDETMKNILNNKFEDFVPCNFSFFPKNVVMNFDVDSKMTVIHSLSLFFKSINVKTSALTIKENNLVFSQIYHIPFLLDKLLFKINNTNFISKDNISEDIYEDIISNKSNISTHLKNLISNIPDIQNEEKILELLNENILLTSTNSKTEIARTTFGKVIIEKLMIRLFQYRDLKAYTDNINLAYTNYKADFLKNYYLTNKEDIEILLLLLKEKINSLIALFELNDLNSSKLKKYLEN